MKTSEIVKRIRRAGWNLSRRGKSHDIYTRDGNANRLTLPRHRMIDRRLAKMILVQMR